MKYTRTLESAMTTGVTVLALIFGLFQCPAQDPATAGRSVLSKIAETVPTHTNFKRDLGKSDESTFRYVFAQPNDANREIMITLMAFDIPTNQCAPAAIVAE